VIQGAYSGISKKRDSLQVITFCKTLSSILVFTLVAVAAPPSGFDFRGLRTGMLEVQGVAALNRLAPKKSWESRVECPYIDGGKICTFHVGEDYTAITINASGVVSGIMYRFQGNADESPESFVRVLSEKYGKPTAEQRSYTNRIGNQFTASAWTWTRGKQVLTVEEVCGEIGTHCVSIEDLTYTKIAKPKI
jgi:hypothetical protein